MAFLSSTLHSLGIFEKISGIKEVLKNRLLDLTKRQDQAREQQRKRPHTSETALRCQPRSGIPQAPLSYLLCYGAVHFQFSPSSALFSSPPPWPYSLASLFLVCSTPPPPGFPSV